MKTISKSILLYCFFLFIVVIIAALLPGYTNKQATISQTNRLKKNFFMFYNVENLFDTIDDPHKNDNEFLPNKGRYWNSYKYWKKIKNIYQVVVAVGNGNMPIVIGLCEIENKQCLLDLTKRTPLNQYGYEIIHYDSPDSRGIDVAMLYQFKQFKILFSKPLQILFPTTIKKDPVRDILYVKGLLCGYDTLHLFINHWPSKLTGKKSDIYRNFIANFLYNYIDSILNKNTNASILIMGDFNDEPASESIKEYLRANLDFRTIQHNKIYNVSYYLKHTKNQWSTKYRNTYSLIDQIMVSGALLDTTSRLFTTVANANVFSSEFLLTDDERYFGKKPFRTYSGINYLGGYSDHLPVYIELFCRIK